MSGFDPGLARERTNRAWTRTALALLVGGLLVVVRHERAFPLPVALAVAGLALLVALLALGEAARRTWTLRASGPSLRPATASVVALGTCTSLLGVATVVAILTT